jgi:hypothetical protein
MTTAAVRLPAIPFAEAIHIPEACAHTQLGAQRYSGGGRGLGKRLCRLAAGSVCLLCRASA